MENVIIFRRPGGGAPDDPAVFPDAEALQMLARLQADVLALEAELDNPAIAWRADIRAGLMLAHDRLQQALTLFAEHVDRSAEAMPLGRHMPGKPPILAPVQF